jgi:hypothetical protein
MDSKSLDEKNPTTKILLSRFVNIKSKSKILGKKLVCWLALGLRNL